MAAAAGAPAALLPAAAEVARLLAGGDAASILVVTGAGIEPDLADLSPNAAHALCALISACGGAHVTTNFSGVQLLAQPEAPLLNAAAEAIGSQLVPGFVVRVLRVFYLLRAFVSHAQGSSGVVALYEEPHHSGRGVRLTSPCGWDNAGRPRHHLRPGGGARREGWASPPALSG